MSDGHLASIRVGSDLVAAEDHVPLYLRAALRLRRDIVGGRLVEGQRIAPERALAEQLGVSRLTVRKALRELFDEGLIAPSVGRGWVVAGGRVGEPPDALLSFSELGKMKGLHASSRVVSMEVRPASVNEAELLGVVAGSELLHLERVRLLDELEIALHRVRVPLARAPRLDEREFTTESLYGVLQETYGIVPCRSDCTIEALPASADVAELLKIAPGYPILRFSQVTFDNERKPFELSQMHYRGDRYRFQATLLRRDDVPTALQG